jgi:hypothetical protein
MCFIFNLQRKNKQLEITKVGNIKYEHVLIQIRIQIECSADIFVKKPPS